MEEHLRIRLDLEPAAEPIAGRLGVESGVGQAFSGYLELIAALEALRSTPADHDRQEEGAEG